MGNSAARQVQGHRYPSGNVYSGQMRGHKRHGQGALQWTDGASYTGQWASDMCDGYGTMTFPNGSKYEGTWVRNNPHGQGVLTTINHEQLRGNWIHTGRSDLTLTTAAKYMFSGELVDIKTGVVRLYNGPLALYLRSGLVSLPNMSDPMLAMLPFAQAMPAAQVAPGGKSDKYDTKEAVPIAQAVQMEPSSSNSIAYGQFELALQQRNLHDHGSVDVADPRLYLASLGLPVYPSNTNVAAQSEHHEQYEATFGQPVARRF